MCLFYYNFYWCECANSIIISADVSLFYYNFYWCECGLFRDGQRYSKMYWLKRYRYTIFEKKNRIKRYNFVGQNFFRRWSDRKNQTKIFSAPMKWYNIPRYKKFHRWSDTIAVHSRKWIDYSILKIVSIKAEFSSQFGGKIGAAEEKSLAP